MNNLEKRLKIKGTAYALTMMCRSEYDCPLYNEPRTNCPIRKVYDMVCKSVTTETWEKLLIKLEIK